MADEKKFEDPQMLDPEDLEDVSGGGCSTGGSGNCGDQELSK